jgi:hypothetical protein
MLSDRTNRRSAIDYPTLRALLPAGAAGLEELAHILERAVLHTFGGPNRLLTAEKRRLRLDLWKLTSLMRQMATLEDVEIFELCFRCPEQMKRYDLAMQALLDLAQRQKLDEPTIDGIRLTLARLWQVRRGITPSVEGLS